MCAVRAILVTMLWFGGLTHCMVRATTVLALKSAEFEGGVKEVAE